MYLFCCAQMLSCVQYVCACIYTRICVCVRVCVCVVVVVLHCIAQILSGCSEWGLLFIAVHRLLIAMASLAVEHRL